MGEQINKEFEDFQKELDERKKRLKKPISFEANPEIDKVIEELKEKEVVL